MIPVLANWDSYYVIVGSSAAALTGLQFVVIALVADSRSRLPTSLRTIAAYGSPTVVHFCTVLLISAILAAPWTSLGPVAWCVAAVGLAGILYDIIVIRRALSQKEYRPELSDWIWHTGLPFVAHATIVLASFLLVHGPTAPLFAMSAASLLLLFVGIHNSWDTVTYIAVTLPSQRAAAEHKRESHSG